MEGGSKAKLIEGRWGNRVIPGQHTALPVTVLIPVKGVDCGHGERQQAPTVTRIDQVAAGGVEIPANIEVIVVRETRVPGIVSGPVIDHGVGRTAVRVRITVALDVLRNFADPARRDDIAGEWLSVGW